jgi:pyruvate dehydrogenase E2 component (dihydrolipoamide acetyltransferase)
LDEAAWKRKEGFLIYNIIIPALGATGGDMVLEDWRAQPGQFVKSGSALFVVTTDKATVEVEAFHDGYLRETLVTPGTTVSVQTVVGRISDTLDEPLSGGITEQAVKEEDRKAQAEEPPKNLSEISTQGGVHRTAIPGDTADPGGENTFRMDTKVAQGRPGRRLASPLARRMAKELGLDLSAIQASGSMGQILKRDVLQAAKQTRIESGVRHVPLSPMRRAIAQLTQKSNAEVPHFHASMAIDMTEAKAMLSQAAVMAERNNLAAPTINDLSIRAAALALRQTPALNASLQGEEMLYFDEINIGVVIGLAEGLLIPVIRHADRLNLFTLAAFTRQLRTAAENGQLSSSQLSGATFTVSNLGMHGLDSFTAVINPPEAGILALGAAKEGPAAWQGSIALRWLMTATLAVDHRIIDGVTAAKFLDAFKQLLENPLSLALEAPREGNA